MNTDPERLSRIIAAEQGIAAPDGWIYCPVMEGMDNMGWRRELPNNRILYAIGRRGAFVFAGMSIAGRDGMWTCCAHNDDGELDNEFACGECSEWSVLDAIEDADRRFPR